MTRIACLVATALLAACGGSPTRPATDYALDYEVVCAQLELTGRAGRALRWYHTSIERRIAYETTFRQALDQIGIAARGRVPGTWAVIVDADDTLLDNAKAECADQLQGVTQFDANRWTNWVYAEAATATPGAVAFAAGVRALGGRLIVVSNREDGLHRQPTIANLAKLCIGYYALLLADNERDFDKTRRFRMVEETGIADAKLPRLPVLAWVGDNVKDFPYLSQVDGGDLGLFGSRYFLVPNPIYGSWQRLPLR